MELRGEGSTGLSDVWRVGLWARLHDANGAYDNLKLLLTQMTLPNVFDLCPAFQIDGNLGDPAVITDGDAPPEHTGRDDAASGAPFALGHGESERRSSSRRWQG